LAKHGYSDTYGARAIARVVRTDLLFPLAQKLLKGTIRDGDVVKIRITGDVLDIQENHLPDPTIIRANSQVDEENPPIDAEAEEANSN